MGSFERTISNRFELVVLASQRARDLSAGASSTLERKKHKNTVLSLAEIEANMLDLSVIFDAAVHKYGKSSDNSLVSSEFFKRPVSNRSDLEDLFSSVNSLHSESESAIKDVEDQDLLPLDDDILADEDNIFVEENDVLDSSSFKDEADDNEN